MKASIHHLAIAAAITMTAALNLNGSTRVACIGNSITYGYGLPDDRRADASYPARLQQMLGPDYTVGNFGHNGATLLRHGHRPYVSLPEYDSALAMKPDIALIHLGVNDTDPRDWPNYSDEFISDYCALIDSLREVNPRMRIIIARLTPIGASHPRFRTGTRLWRLLEQEAIEKVARTRGVELMDFDEPLRDRQELMPDAVHPDSTGYAMLARTAWRAITGNYGGLRLPDFYQSGMILQRHRPLTIAGTANAGDAVTLTLDGISYFTVADNRGHWNVSTAPLADGTDYTMTVSTPDSTINLTDIAAGELWIASGQSNMEFPLSNCIGADSLISSSADPLLRFYDMRGVSRPNNRRWSDEAIAATDTLGYFLPSEWQQASPSTVGTLSAIAYCFARNLRDSLNVPVGIISNGVGGAPCEAWIDRSTLEEHTPEALLNWRRNDYVQPWCQQEADRNSPAPHRHPYEPGYLFACGIRPLGSPDIAGVIWYQGESNAHNVELHEQFFPMLVDSWRHEFRRQDLPFIFVQLSSINRPSWPAFRNSQRRLADSLPRVWMAVSSDLGDSLDVHPRHKRPIGNRLALQALKNVYGHTDIAAEGPVPVRAQTGRDGTVIVTFDRQLATSDGRQPTTFEVADDSGIFHPANAIMATPGQVMLMPTVKRPRYVRYAWQPFTRANLMAPDSLPTSTFLIEIDNMDELFSAEPGFDRGLSASFAGTMPDGAVYLAGGCNFPCDNPLGPGAEKKFYKGIYRFDGQGWKRTGSLKTSLAYGASVSTPDGILLIGGTDTNGSSSQVTLLRADMSTKALPSLPEPIDNMGAAMVDGTVYVVGGNRDGKPSRECYALSLADPSKGWRRLRSMPGNPRVQPVVAASAGKLYVWGGFAGRHDKHEPTLELDGLVYDPATGKWAGIAGPALADGTPVATGGGAAVTLPDGRIAIAGGVNKDIFLDALIDQAPDYLNHPIAWYRLNPTVFIYDPAAAVWSVLDSRPELARAGASATVTDGKLIIAGGELKPRIRTPYTAIIPL